MYHLSNKQIFRYTTSLKQFALNTIIFISSSVYSFQIKHSSKMCIQKPISLTCLFDVILIFVIS